MNFVWCALAVLAIWSGAVESQQSNENLEHVVVETKSGKVRGLRKSTLLKNFDYFSFKGIPYAKTPVGSLRFKAPEPVEPWAPAIKDATEHGYTCVRPTQFFIDKEPQSEDCLFLNVYVPGDVRPEERLPVMVYIHGGAFQEGSGNTDTYGPDFIVEHRVILVTFNYRLGVFGFLSLGTPEYSGNMALKDQQLVLKWVQENIGCFGGDNQAVTLVGESAGGASTHFHLISSESRKYFRAAAPMSGTTFNYWAFSKQNDHTDYAYKMAAELGQPKQSYNELVEFLKTVPADKIYQHGNVIDLLKRTARGVFAPVIEKRDAIQPFIVEPPSKIYSESRIDVDTMFSLCAAEGLTFYMKALDEMYNYDGLNCNFTLKLPFDEAMVPYDSPEYQNIAAEIRKFYFKDSAIDKNVLQEYIDFISDLNFAYGIDKAARQQAAQTNRNTFFYRFSVDSKLTISKRLNPEVHQVNGAGHGNELCYMFRCGAAQPFYDDILANKDDEQSRVSLRTIDNLTKIVTNFVKYGSPGYYGDPVDLAPIQNNQVNFVDITNEGLRIGVNPNAAANELWSRVERQVQDYNQRNAKSTFCNARV